MDVVPSRARQSRAHRHELRTLTYAAVDQENGGVVRNLTSKGMGLQVVAALPPHEQLRVQFELRNPRLRVEALAEVKWSTRSGECGIGFVDLPPRTCRQIDEWIFGDLLEGVSPRSGRAETIFAGSMSGSLLTNELQVSESVTADEEVDDGLMVSATPLKVIELPTRPELPPEPILMHRSFSEPPAETTVPLDWLSQPLSGRGLAWTVNVLMVVSALLLFALVFLSLVGGAPPWPFAVMCGIACLVTVLYWGFCQMFGGSSLGTRLARLVDGDAEDEESVSTRFR